VHIAEQKRIVQILHGWIEETPCGSVIGDTARYKYIVHQRVDVCRAGERVVFDSGGTGNKSSHDITSLSSKLHGRTGCKFIYRFVYRMEHKQEPPQAPACRISFK
jgi:hypothetical protein